MRFFTLLATLGTSHSFAPTVIHNGWRKRVELPTKSGTTFFVSPEQENENAEYLGTKIGGYTVKQRLREELESPFRKVRLIFFLGSAGSALTALYFSTTNALKASMGDFPDAPSLEDSLASCGINAVGALVCGYLAYNDYQRGQQNLERIAKGGALARLVVMPASESNGSPRTLKDFRRNSRVLIAAGGTAYISELARSLNSDQLADSNNLAARLEQEDVVIIPVLLDENGDKVGDSKSCWLEAESTESDRNFDIRRADSVVAFPLRLAAWEEYLKSEVETARSQGFDVVEKGFTITVKKNGRILRRATGQPQWSNFLGAMEILDESRFGMPGDTERYGGA